MKNGKNSAAIDRMVEKLSKKEADIYEIPAGDETLQRIVRVNTKKGVILIDEQTGDVVNAMGIWRAGKVDVGIIDGEELIALNSILTDMRLTNPMAANLVHRYFLDVKNKEEK